MLDMRVASLLPISILYVHSLGAQSQSASRAFDAARLRPAVDTFVTVTGSGERVDTIGWATQTLRRAPSARGDTWIQVYQWHGRDGSESTDSLVMDRRSLRPLTEVRSTVVGRVTVNYDGAHVRAQILPARGASQQRDTTYRALVYSSSSLELLARAMATHERAAARLALYYPFPAQFGIREVELSVSGDDVVRARDGSKQDCWIVSVRLPSGISQFWIAKSDTTLVKFSSGEGGSVFWFLRPRAPAT